MDGEGFGKEISEIVGARNKQDSELVLSDSALDPIESHVD